MSGALMLLSRLVTPSKGRRGRRRPRAVAATTPVSAPKSAASIRINPYGDNQ